MILVEVLVANMAGGSMAQRDSVLHLQSPTIEVYPHIGFLRQLHRALKWLDIDMLVI